MSVSLLIWLSTRKCTREIRRTSGEAAKFEIARGYTADVFLNHTVLQGVTTGFERRNFVSRIQ